MKEIVVSNGLYPIITQALEAASIYQAGFPKELLLMQEDVNIKYDENEHFNFNPYDNNYSIPLFGYNRNITDQDYENSIQEFIATPRCLVKSLASICFIVLVFMLH